MQTYSNCLAEGSRSELAVLHVRYVKGENVIGYTCVWDGIGKNRVLGMCTGAGVVLQTIGFKRLPRA